MHVPIATTLALSAPRIRCAGLANTIKAWNDVAGVRIFEQVSLDSTQNAIGVFAREVVQTPRESSRLYEYHTVVYTT